MLTPDDPAFPRDHDGLIPFGSFSEVLAPGAVVLRGFARPCASAALQAIAAIAAVSPFRTMTTRGGYQMSVALTSCGTLGWVTDASGYRYSTCDPLTGRPWPSMPAVLRELAVTAAAAAGYPTFDPDSCMVNRYEPGARLTLHQDRTERTHTAPVVSVSFGLPIRFQFGGAERRDPVRSMLLTHGDVAVWGGPARLAYHGVLPLKEGDHPMTGRCRLNITFRQAG